MEITRVPLILVTIPLLIYSIKQVYQTSEELTQNEQYTNLPENLKNICLNKKSKEILTPYQQYIEFVKGPCSPLVIVPGMLGTTLQITIDCQNLQKDYSQIFENCGWTTCYENRNNFLRQSKPEKEYRLWIGDLFSPTTILQFKNSKCFGDLIYLGNPLGPQNKTSPVQIQWFGNTPETKSQSQCGVNSIKDLSRSDILQKTSCQVKGFQNLIYLLDFMGYQTGLTFQAIPYDFRINIKQNHVQSKIINTVNQLYKNTGKKIILLGHSLGNLHIQEALSQISLIDKETKIKQLLAIAPPFLGAPKVFMNLFGGDPQYIKSILGLFQVGINFYSQKSLAGTSSSIYDMLSKNTFQKFQNEEWMKQIIQRINYENSSQNDINIPFSYIFPSKNETCIDSQEQFKARKSQNCTTGILNLLEKHILQINETQFYSKQEDIIEIIEKYSIFNSTSSLSLFNQSNNLEAIANIQNPQIPTAIFYGAMIDTIQVVQYNKDTKKTIEQTEDFYFPDNMEYTIGDGTIPSYTAIIPAFKWAFEYENKKTKGAKPIKLIEFCSKYNQSMNFYSENFNKEKTFNENQYQGLQCECNNDNDAHKCSHSCMINDQYFIQLMSEILLDYQVSKNKEFLSEQEIIYIIQNCPNLY